jgi:CRP-like cAMP-binding protein
MMVDELAARRIERTGSARTSPDIASEVAKDPGRDVHFPPHSSIFREGDAVGCVYQVRSGSIMLYKLLPDGRRQVVEVVGPGDVFGFSPVWIHDCSAQTLVATECIAFDRSLLERSPTLLWRLSSRLYQQLCALHEHVTLLGRKSARERIASFLMRCIPDRGGNDCHGPRGGDDEAHVRLAMTRSEIADYLGLTIETVSRNLTQLKRRGLVSISKLDEITVHDVCRLCLLTGSLSGAARRRGTQSQVASSRLCDRLG